MGKRKVANALAGALLALLASTCGRVPEPGPGPLALEAGASPTHAASAVSSRDRDSTASQVDAGRDRSLELSPGPSSAATCPEDMLPVEGEFCPAALQNCIKHHPEYEARSSVTASERCLEFRAPSKCLSKTRKHLRFCIDRFEWPNRRGELPLILVQWLEARKLCESVGKRLCDEDEWVFACEGEDMLPHVYGFKRDATKCQIDRPYIKRERHLKRHDECLADAECKADLQKLDQRKPAGSFLECVSSFGAYDMNGSINEWVNLPGKKPPHRSGLKGGWWGPVRCRCRPTVTFHKEDDWGYEAGLRCCKDIPQVTGSPGSSGPDTASQVGGEL